MRCLGPGSITDEQFSSLRGVVSLSKRTVCWIVAGLCGLAAIRILLFAAAFPFFNNVDEQAHVDLVFKYAHGKPPRGIERFSSEATRYLVIYRTPEYFNKPEQFDGGYPAPNWLLPKDELQKVLDEETRFWNLRLNHESGEPPVYYAIAATWTNLGRLLGLRGLPLLYWVRFLNAGFGALLVWIGFLAAKSTFSENQFVQIGVATLLAVWPQSALYSIQPDALSPLCFGIAFLGLTTLLQSEHPRSGAAIWGGWRWPQRVSSKQSICPCRWSQPLFSGRRCFWAQISKDADCSCHLESF